MTTHPLPISPSPHLSPSLLIADFVAPTEVEGPGRRAAIWVQGCPLRCPGCANPELLSFEGGARTSVDELVKRILALKGLEGITLLGGEPLCQASNLAKVAEGVRAAGLSVMLYTGYTYQGLLSWLSGEGSLVGEARLDREGVRALLEQVDLLVDGPYEAREQSARRRYIGSDNQGIYALSETYRALVERWPEGDAGIEIRIKAGSLRVTGSPARREAFLWAQRLREEE